jgi:Zn-dependent protease
MPTKQGSLRLFQLFGITVYLHWSWFLIVVYDIQVRTSHYRSAMWNVLEILTLFLIVLMHEFGHALACKQVGGQANQIVLWPLGGVAYVSPPQRPGAMLWSIAAGPLVNVALFPIISGLVLLARSMGWPETSPNVYTYLVTVWLTNLVLLIFNMLPVYPLDGGQILRSLLWFIFGRANSLMIASIIGFLGVAGVAFGAYLAQSLWLGILAAFIAMNCWTGFKQAQILSRMEKMPRRPEFSCPVCHASPPIGAFWVCGKCRTPFDTFATGAICPNCATAYPATMCLDCRSLRPLNEWTSSPTPPKI